MISTRTLAILEALALLLLLLGGAEAQQRLRATGPVTFYAAPNGIDTGNSCLSPAAPCTLQGAFNEMQNNWDFGSQVEERCFIKLADGSYPILHAVGQFVGAHVCGIRGNLDQNLNCIDRTSAQVALFDIEDGMIIGTSCVTATWYGRQDVIIDIDHVACLPPPAGLSNCISLVENAKVNSSGDLWIIGSMNGLLTIDLNSFAGLNGPVVVTNPVTIPYFVTVQNWSTVRFSGGFTNPQLVGSSQCNVGRPESLSWVGIIPCTVNVQYP